MKVIDEYDIPTCTECGTKLLDSPFQALIEIKKDTFICYDCTKKMLNELESRRKIL